MKNMTLPARDETLSVLQEMIDQELEAAGCGMAEMSVIALCVEEVFVNIAHYAYAETEAGEGDAEIEFDILENPRRFYICFKDRGKPYNPLEREDPDITLSVEERPIGGLGVYLVKKMMTSTKYAYEDGRNVFTMEKDF